MSLKVGNANVDLPSIVLELQRHANLIDSSQLMFERVITLFLYKFFVTILVQVIFM